jgi:hypothetical protein
MLSKSQIFAAEDMRLEKVEVPEWGGHLFVRNMDGKARSRYEYQVKQASKSGNFSGVREKLVAMVACDEQGRLLFDEDKDIEALGKKSCHVLDRICTAALKVNGISAEDVDELKKI